MICARCRTENPDGAAFCMGCGAPSGDVSGPSCGACGATLAAGARFCHACGTPAGGGAPASPGGIDDAIRRLMPREYVDQLTATRGRVTGERREITILFVDVHGSVALGENLDPEEVMDIMNGAFEVLIGPVLRYEGTLARLMGDAVLAFFGAPIAHEDDPDRACRAAIDMVAGARDYAERLERERGIRGFRVRVGINTGLVAVGEVGSDLRVEYTAMGDAVNLAARMESAAEPGTILLTAETAKRVRRAFEVDAARPISVKGKSAPVEACRLLGLRGEPGAPPEGGTPFVGRAREIDALRESFRRLSRGEGGTVAIVGDAGIGKSRLLAEARRLVPSGTAWVQGRCVAYGEGMGVWPVRDVLHDLLGTARSASPEEKAAALRDLLTLTGEEGDAEGLFPYLARLADVSPGGDWERRLGRMPSDELRRRMMDALARFLRLCLRRGPHVLVWEDLHWMDPTTSVFLDHLAPLAANEPVLLVFLFRGDEGEAAAFRGRLEGASAASHRTIELAPLSRGESGELVDRLAGATSIAEETRRALLLGAEGNPFFLEEMIGSLADPGESAPTGVALPGTVQGVIMARLDRLPPDAKRVLQTASVLGHSFARSVLLPLDARAGGGGDPAEGIRLLVRRGFFVDDDERREGEPLLAFKHAITAEVAYNSLLRRRRRELHRLAGETIEAAFPSRLEELAPVIAHHFERGEAPKRAFVHLLVAARRAVRVCANPEAAAYFERAAAIAGRSDSGVKDDEAAAVFEEVGDVRFQMGEYRAAMEAYDRALEKTTDAARTVALHRKRGRTLEKWGRASEARTCFEEGLRGMRHGADPVEVARIYSGLALVHASESRMEEASRMAAVAVKLMKSLGDRWGLAQACNNLGVIHSKRGAWDEAVLHLERCRAICEELGDTYGLASCRNNLGLVCRQRGERGRAEEHFRESIRLFERLGNRHGLARAYDNLSQVYVEDGHPDRAMEYLKEAMVILSEIGVEGREFVPEMWQSGAW